MSDPSYFNAGAIETILPLSLIESLYKRHGIAWQAYLYCWLNNWIEEVSNESCYRIFTGADEPYWKTKAAFHKSILPVDRPRSA